MLRQVSNVIRQSQRTVAASSAVRSISTTQPVLAESADDIKLEALKKPKISLYGVHGRYANALYSAASKQGKLQQAEKDLNDFTEIAGSDAVFAAYLKNPTVSRVEKRNVVEEVASAEKIGEPVGAFVAVMAENGRMGDLAKINASFQQLMKAERGEVAARVISAEPLSQAQLNSVQKALGKYVSSGEKIVLEAKVDPAILGGLKVQIGERFLDLSISSRINKMHQLLAEPV